MLRSVLTIALAMFMAVSAAPASAAAPLAGSVPSDALLYIGWRGANDPGATYEKSHLKAVAEASDLVPSLAKMMPMLVDKLGEQDPNAAMMAQATMAIAKATWRYPTAVYIAMDPPDPQRPPMPKVAIVVKAGAESANVLAELEPLLEGAPPDVRRIALGDGYVLVTNVPEGPLEALILKPGVDGALSKHKPFVDALQRTQNEPNVAVYADVEAIVGRINSVMAEQEKQMAAAGRPIPRDMVQFKQVMAALAPEQMQRVMVTMGFAGVDWESAAFIESSGERTGIAKWLVGAPLKDDVLKVVPESAAMVSAAAFDLKATYNAIREAIAGFDPRMSQELEAAIADLEENAGLKIGDDILAGFGDQWAMYTDRDVATTSVMGLVVVNQLADADKAESALWKLAALFNAAVSDAIGDPDITVQIKQVKRNGVTIHYLAIPAVAIAWAIDDGRLYLGLQPQSVAGAIDFARSKGRSILDNEQFVRTRTAVRGVGGVSSISYIDLPQKVNDAYALNLLITRYITGFADIFGIDAPVFAIPPLTDLRPHLGPAMAANWTDDAGFHFRARSPFPMAELLATEQNIGAAQGALMAGILLPSLSRAREIANRSVSAANLTGIYKSAYTYSVTNKDKFPDKLSVLVQDGSVGVMSVIHPADPNVKAQDMPVLPLDDPKLAAWIDANTSYVWLPGKGSAAPADDIIAYEKWHIVSDVNGDEGMNILYGDSHVSFVDLFTAVKELKRCGIEIPEDYKWMLEVEDFGPRGEANDRPVPPPPGDAYFYDVVTKKYFTALATKIPPIKSPDGNDAIRAHFFTCGDCTDEQKFLGYYEKYSLEVKAKIEKDPESMHFYEEVFKGRYYCAPENDPTKAESWVAAEGEGGFAVAQKLQEKCPPRKLRYCPPPRK